MALLLTSFIVCSVIVVATENSIFVHAEPISYFDELGKISQYKQLADKIKIDDFSYAPAYLKEAFHALVTSSDSNDNNEKYSMNKLLFFLKLYLESKNSSSTCVRDVGRLVTSILSATPWALQFVDSMGKPGPSLSHLWVTLAGNYDQCRAAVAPPTSNTTNDGYKGNYCVLSYDLPLNFSIPFPMSLGSCFPRTCTQDEVTELVKDIAVLANLSVRSLGEVHCLEAKTEITTATVFAIIFLALSGGLTLLGTLYDIVFIQRDIASSVIKLQNGTDAKGSDDDEIIVANDEDTAPLQKQLKSIDIDNDQHTIVKILLAFSAYTNGKKVLDTTKQSGSLDSIHGIRFLSMCWVVLGHTFVFSLQYSENGIFFAKKVLDRWSFDAISNALLSVDTFFTLSGLLTSYLTIRELKRNGMCINWGKFYFHRFWRLTPPYMLTILFFLGIQQYLGEGPLWKNEQPNDKTFCEKNWWTNLLYINNLVHPTEPCFAHSWYLANDFQFFLVSPLMLIPFYFHRLAGVVSCLIFLVVSWVTTGVLTIHNGWGTSITSIALGNYHWFDHYYIVPWCRIGPYVVGILAGYILGETIGKPFRMRWWMVATGWMVATASALAIVYGIHGDITMEHPLGHSVEALYNSLARSAWGACVCWVIIACSTGYGGPVNTLLSWSPFVVLGRLTYMTYLIHLPFISIFLQNLGMPINLNDMTMAVLFIGVLGFSNMAAFVFMLLFESPTIGLERAFLRPRAK